MNRSLVSRATVEPRLLTIEQTAALLGVPVSKALAMARRGDLPAVKLMHIQEWRVDWILLEKRLAYFKDIAVRWTPARSRMWVPEPRRYPKLKRTGSKPRALPEGAPHMSVWDAAELLEVTPFTIKSRIQDGTFRASKPGRTWLVSAEDVHEAVREKGGSGISSL